MEQLKHAESNYHHYLLDLLLLFYFLVIQENLHIMSLFLNLFFEDDNKINSQYQN